MMLLSSVFASCSISVLYATSEKVKKCIFAQPGTPYHDQKLCSMDDLSEEVLNTDLTQAMAEILDLRNGTKIVRRPYLTISTDKTIPQQAVPDLDHPCFIKNVASFLGEEWTSGQNPRWREIEESWSGPKKVVHELKVNGGTIEQSVWFLKPFLTTPNFYGLDLKFVLDEQQMDTAEYIVNKMGEIVVFENVINGSLGIWEKANFLANYFAGLVEPMKEWLIPVYFNSALGGHVILMSFVKTDQEHVNITIYNTGEGVSFHDKLQGNTHERYNFELKFSGLHADRDLLNTTFFDMIAEFTTGAGKGEKYDAELFYNNVLGAFAKHRVDPSTDHRDYSIPQKAGNCYQKVVLAYMKAKLGYLNYKKLEREMRFRLVEKLFDENFYKKNWFQQEIILRALKSEARSWTRLFTKGNLSKEMLGQKIEVINKKLDVVRSLKLDRYIGCNVMEKYEFSRWIHPAVACRKASRKRSSGKPLDGDILYKKCIHLDDPESIIGRTEEILSYVNTRVLNAAAYHGFAWMLNIPMPSLDGDDVYKSFTPEQLLKLLNVSTELLKSISSKSSSVVAVISAAKCLALAWRSLIIKGSPLAKAKIDLQALKMPFAAELIFFYTPEILREYTTIIEYLEACSSQLDDGSLLLFEGITKPQLGSFNFMSQSSAEYQFLASLKLTDEEEGLLSDLERNPPSSAQFAIKEVLKEEKLRLSYLYMIKNDHVPEEFHLVRDLLTYVSELSTQRRIYLTRKCEIRFYASSSVAELYNIFKCQSHDDLRIQYRTQHSIRQENFDSSSENTILINEKPFANPMKTDLALLELEHAATKIYFAINCISQYTSEIFSDESNFETIMSSFFQGCCLREFIESNPLDGALALKRTLTSATQKLYSTALLTENWHSYKKCKDFEALVYHWLGQVSYPLLDPQDCPAAYLGKPEALFYIGKKPKYLQEFLALSLKESYPRDLVMKLMKFKTVPRLFTDLGLDPEKVEESLSHEYPYVSAAVNGQTYIYDFWEDVVFSGKMLKDDIYCADVLKDCKMKSEYLDLLAETGEFSFGKNRYGLVEAAICKIVNESAYKPASIVEKFKSVSCFQPFEKRTDESNSSYIIDFKLSLEPTMAGRQFLEVQESKTTEKEFWTVYDGQNWKLGGNETEIPKLIDNFGEGRDLLAWEIGLEEKLFIFTNMFTDDLQTIAFKCRETRCFYQGMQIVEETNKVYKRYPQSIIFRNSENQEFALLPMESRVNNTLRTPCIKFQLDNGKILPVKREKKIQLALYYLSRGLYKKALDLLQSAVIVSNFTETELIHLNNIIYYNRDGLDSRPDQASVSYYALYMKFKIGNQELKENPEIALFKEFSNAKGNDAAVMRKYYSSIGRVPPNLLVTSPILCSPDMKSPKWIGCKEEIHFIEVFLHHHSRLSQIQQEVGMIYISPLSNKTLNLDKHLPLQYIESWKLVKNSGSEIIQTIRKFTSKLRIKENRIRSLMYTILSSMNSDISESVKTYIKSLIMTTELESEYSQHYLIILAVMHNPSILSDLMGRLLGSKEYETIVKSELVPIFIKYHSDFTFKPKDLVLPSKPIFFGDYGIPMADLKKIREGYSRVEVRTRESCFDSVKKLFVTTCLKTDETSSFTKLENTLLKNSVISRPAKEGDVAEEYKEMWNKLPNSKIDLIPDNQEAGGIVKNILRNCVSEMEQAVSAIQKDILTLANTPSEQYREEFFGLLTAGIIASVKIETLLRGYATESVDVYYQHLRHVDNGNILKIHLLMNDYLHFHSLYKRSERALKAFEQGHYSKVLEEMHKDFIAADMIPIVLLMEYHLGFRIRPKNIHNIQTMAGRNGLNYKNYVLQAIMGSGKTEVISPALAFLKADGEHISMFCPPSTHFETNSEKLLSYSKKIFGQGSYVLNFSRDPKLTNSAALKNTFELLNDSILEKNSVIVKFESLQSMVNQFIFLLKDEAASEEKEKGQISELVMLGKNLDLMKNKGSITFDEVDFTFRTNRMFNFPAGISQEMDRDTIDTIKMVLRKTVELKDQLAHYGVYPLTGMTQNISKARLEIVRKIGESLVSHLFHDKDLPKSFAWVASMRDNTEIQDTLVKFFVDEPLGLKKTLSSLGLVDESQIKTMILVQNLIQSLIPDNWATVCNLHYGFSKYADLKPSDAMYCGVAKPYAFAGEPKENSNWANKYETAVKTFQMYLENGLSEQQYTNFIMHLQKKALDEAMYYGKELVTTDVILRFNSYKIMNDGENVRLFNAKTEASNCLSPSTKDLMVKKLKGTADPNFVEFILDFVFEIPMKKETFYSSQVVNTAQFMGTRFKVCQGFSGTAQRDYQFWENVDFIPDLGSSVAVQSTILEQPGLVYQIEDEHSVVFLCSGDRSGEFDLSELDKRSQTVIWTSPDRTFNKGFTTKFQIFKAQEQSLLDDVKKQDKVRAMIDLGAFFRTMKNDEAARKLLEYSGEDIRCIVYYSQDNKLSFFKKEQSISDHHYIDGPHQLHSEHLNDVLKETGCSLDQIFVYYDQKHILGSDFKMIDGAVAYVTVGPTTTRTDLEQAVMRMRGLLAKLQTLRFIIRKDVASTILSKKKESGDGHEDVGLFGIIRHCIDNETHFFKSPDTSGRTNMQNMQLLYQKVKAQYMDVAFTRLARLASSGDVAAAKILFKDVHDWFIDSTDEFYPVEESQYHEVLLVLLGFSDKMFEHLNRLLQWEPVREELLNAKKVAENAIQAFVKRGIVEPKTPSPVSTKNFSSTEVQNENQNQNQNQSQMSIELTKSEKSSAVFESSYPALSCSQAVSAAMQMQNRWKGRNLNFFDDNFKISPNFIKTESHNDPFVKTPAYFVRFDECIVAITHKEMEWIRIMADLHNNVFMIVEDDILSINGAKSNIELTSNDLVNLLIFKGDFETLNKHSYERTLVKWIEKRKLFGPELIPIIDSYDIKETGFFKTSSFKKILEKELISRGHIPLNEYSSVDKDFFKANPILGLELIFRKSSPTFEEYMEYFSLQLLVEFFAKNNILSISNLFDINPKFVLSIENLWDVAKGQDMLKFEALFCKSDYDDKVLDISVSDVLGLMHAAGRRSPSREATLKFMKFAKDERMVTFARMFYEVSSELEGQYKLVLSDLLNDYWDDFLNYPNTREVMSMFTLTPRQSVLALYVLKRLGTNHDQWVELIKKYLAIPSDYMHISFESMLQISNAKELVETDPSLLDEFVGIVKEKQQYYEEQIIKLSCYLLEQNSPFLEKFTRQNNSTLGVLIHAVKIGRIDEVELLNAIREKQSMDEILSITFDLMKNPRPEPDLDVFSLIQHYDSYTSLIQGFFVRYKFDLGRFLCGNIFFIKPEELSAAFLMHASKLRSHPEYLDKALKLLENKDFQTEYIALIKILDENKIPYTKHSSQNTK